MIPSARQSQRDAFAQMLWTAIANHPSGLTARDLAAHFNRRLEIIRPRLTEMAQAKQIVCVGHRRFGSRGRAERIWSTTDQQ